MCRGCDSCNGVGRSVVKVTRTDDTIVPSGDVLRSIIRKVKKGKRGDAQRVHSLRAPPVGAPPTSGDPLEWQNSSSGFGAKLMSKYGWAEGDALGVRPGGLVEPLEAHRRPKRRGIGSCDDT